MNTKQHLLTNTSHVPALFHTTVHTQAPPIPVCIAPKCPASFFFQARFSSTRLSTSDSHPPLPSLALSPFLCSRFSEILNLDYYGRKICAKLLLLRRGCTAKDNMVFLYFAEPTLWRLLGFFFLFFFFSYSNLTQL